MRAFLRYWIFRLTAALRWYLGARTRYDVHSPFLSDFVRDVYYDKRHYQAFDSIKALRKYWRTQRQPVKLLSLGAPSRTTRRDRRSAASLVSSSAIGAASGKFLFRLTLWLQPARIIEFGTNAGISTAYLQLADTRTPVATVEGNPEVAALARETFERLGPLPQLTAATTTFSDWLDGQPTTPSTRLLFFLDGDHRYAPTLNYVDRVLAWATDDSVIVVADIHWSPEMERAWTKLKALPRVTASVDTYHFGLLFLRKESNGPHLSLIPTRYKPWRVGFF